MSFRDSVLYDSVYFVRVWLHQVRISAFAIMNAMPQWL